MKTHTNGSFYEHLPVQRAGELSEPSDFVYTPKHGSWLNMAEIEFPALARQCLDKPIASIEEFKPLTHQWSEKRNNDKVKIHRSFTTEKTRKNDLPIPKSQ